jgi:hypothetical protein
MSDACGKDYKVKSFFNKETGKCSAFHWYNQQGQKDAPGDYPSCVIFSKAGLIEQAHWEREDKLHRENGYPTTLYFSETTGKLVGANWSSNGENSREHGLPSAVIINEDTGMPEHLEFMLDGEHFRPKEKHTYIDFDSDGTAYDNDGNIIEVGDFHTGWLDSIPKEALLDHAQFSQYSFS